MTKLGIIIASTRPGRIGLPISQWMAEEARSHGGFDEVELIDLAEINLPFFDEPHHPRLRTYIHDHTVKWSELVDGVDAFIMVTPEYNYGISAVLKNAIDYLNAEWAYKAVGFVSYGGVSAGTRAVQMTKQVVSTLRMMPVLDAVSLPFAMNNVDEDGYHPNEIATGAAKAMLDELVKVDEQLRGLRNSAS
ncbi:NADPH-dependent FMN reductase [Streptomyces sp. NRRL WC-3742]|uniref:NADPH-dependent FMN reductase n=1 Tax=Streptomyces sp. NRRL WC-3742 TaxID=1463934 RepID=UPI0004C5A230|nr:NAD(P)H-dependent oxidoreductase [Streptomyces sp. NRRL WC-3742]